MVLEDVLSSNLRKAEQVLQENGKIAGELRLALSVEDAVREADVAIDFVPDELESKLEILSMMDRMAPPRTIFCTPTTLSISDLASCTYRAAQCVALVPSGEQLGRETQLVRGQAAADETVALVVAWLETLGTAVVVTAETLDVLPGCSV